METKKIRFLKDTKAVSYPLFVIILTLIIGTGVYIVCTPAVNVMTLIFNNFIDSGTASTQTAQALSFNLNLYKILPFFFILGLFLYGIVQALLKKQSEG